MLGTHCSNDKRGDVTFNEGREEGNAVGKDLFWEGVTTGCIRVESEERRAAARRDRWRAFVNGRNKIDALT
jgi:hypothetical protein